MKTLYIILAVVAIVLLIFIVVIVGIALWYMGVFNMEGSTKTFTGFGMVKPVDWAVYEDGSGVITMASSVQAIPLTINGVPR